MANGWQEAVINEAFISINSPMSSTPPDNIAAQQFSTISQQPARRINKTLLAVVSILGILIIGGGVFGYFYYFQETPEKVIEKMKTRLTEVKTLEYQGEISDFSINFNINFNGKSDVGDLNNPKGLFAFNIKQGESALGLEIRTIDKVVYIKLNGLPNLAGSFDLSVLSNQWIKIDTAPIKEDQKQQELTPEQVEKLKQIVKQAEIFKVTEKLASEKNGEVNTHHYKFLIDKNELKKLIVDIIKVVQDKTLTNEELAEFDKVLEAIETLGGEIWIGKKDYLPYKILLMLKETAESKTAGQLQLMTVTLSFKNYNKPVQIDIPSSVKSIEEIFGQQLPEFQPNLQLPTR